MTANRFNEFALAKSDAVDINMIALVKGRERYVFYFDDESRAACLLTMGRFASNC